LRDEITGVINIAPLATAVSESCSHVGAADVGAQVSSATVGMHVSTADIGMQVSSADVGMQVSGSAPAYVAMQVSSADVGMQVSLADVGMHVSSADVGLQISSAEQDADVASSAVGLSAVGRSASAQAARFNRLGPSWSRENIAAEQRRARIAAEQRENMQQAVGSSADGRHVSSSDVEEAFKRSGKYEPINSVFLEWMNSPESISRYPELKRDHPNHLQFVKRFFQSKEEMKIYKAMLSKGTLPGQSHTRGENRGNGSSSQSSAQPAVSLAARGLDPDFDRICSQRVFKGSGKSSKRLDRST
jgi:hypothetical protein